MNKSLKEREIRLKEQWNLYRRAKGVIIGKASSGVLTFSAGFRLGSRFAYFVYIACGTTKENLRQEYRYSSM